ncbi:MAG: transposase family protein [Opitutaceae bacterium]|nr:transposase family protein [Cytophagales bacterium]
MQVPSYAIDKVETVKVSGILEQRGTVESRKALELALHGFGGSNSQLIHHSDRGLQYCSYVYVKILQQNGIRISMTETSEPTENAIAERVNGILKN